MMKKAEKAMEELVKKQHKMVKNVDEMIPKKKGGPLDIDTMLEQEPEETKKIMGMTSGEAIPNKYLDRLKEFKMKEE